MSEKDSRAHSDCTRDDAQEALRNNGAELAAFIAGLNDDELDRKGSMPAAGGKAGVNQMIEFVIFQSFQTLYQANLAVYTALMETGTTIPFP
jgi:hypothetical protein